VTSIAATVVAVDPGGMVRIVVAVDMHRQRRGQARAINHRRRNEAAARSAAPCRSVVEHRGDLWIVDVGLVVIIEAGVDHLRQLLALERLDGLLHSTFANADRVLGDRTEPHAGADRVLLFLAGIVTDDDELLAAFLDTDRNALRRAFIGAEDAIQV